MSPELISIIGALVALAAVILSGQHAMRRDIAGIHHDVAGLRERMARLGGTVQVVIRVLTSRTRDRTLRIPAFAGVTVGGVPVGAVGAVIPASAGMTISTQDATLRHARESGNPRVTNNPVLRRCAQVAQDFTDQGLVDRERPAATP